MTTPTAFDTVTAGLSTSDGTGVVVERLVALGQAEGIRCKDRQTGTLIHSQSSGAHWPWMGTWWS